MTGQRVNHELQPVYDRDAKILILGTMPSPKSREFGFYYSHPQNKLWRILGSVFQEPVPDTPEEKTKFLLKHQIAMWDVLKTCMIQGADDNSIKSPEPNDLKLILDAAEIRAIFTTGKKATELYHRLCEPKTGRPSIYLPSTSPANCRNYTLESLTDEYQILLRYL